MQTRASGSPRSCPLPSPDLGPASLAPNPPLSLYHSLPLFLCSDSLVCLCPLPCPGPGSRSSWWPNQAPQRREGIRASGRAGPGCWAGVGISRCLPLDWDPAGPAPPRLGRGPSHPQLWGRRERGKKTPSFTQAGGEVHSGETLWPFSENSHLLSLPASFRLSHQGSCGEKGILRLPPRSYQSEAR